MIGIYLALGALALAFALGLFRAVRGPSVADRALAADLCLYAIVAAIALLALRTGFEETGFHQSNDEVRVTGASGETLAFDRSRDQIQGLPSPHHCAVRERPTSSRGSGLAASRNPNSHASSTKRSSSRTSRRPRLLPELRVLLVPPSRTSLLPWSLPPPRSSASPQGQ
jgi:hypothetical protein